jgi:hypothetical protein
VRKEIQFGLLPVNPFIADGSAALLRSGCRSFPQMPKIKVEMV